MLLADDVSSAKDTVFHIYATSDTLSFLDSNYKYSNNYENKESYVCVNNNEIYCKVKNNNNKYELEFIIYDYNQKLIDIME